MKEFSSMCYNIIITGEIEISESKLSYDSESQKK